MSPFIPIQNVSLPLDLQKFIVMCFGLTLIYFGRFTTRINGISYGKSHFIGLFILSSFYGFVASGLWILDKMDHAMKFNIGALIELVNILWMKYLSIFSESLDHTVSYAIGFTLGLFALSTFGEYYLGGYINCPLTTPDKRTLMQIIDKLPSDFEIITGNVRTIDKLDAMINPKNGSKVKSMRCITKSCTLIEDIYNVDEKYEYKKLRDNPYCACRIIKCTDHDLYDDFIKSLDNLPIPWNQIIDKEYEYIKSVDEYRERIYNIYLKLKPKDGLKNNVEIESFYLDELRYVIFEYDDRKYKMLIISKEKALFRPSRVGIYTEQIYIISEFIELFDSLWQEVKRQRIISPQAEGPSIAPPHGSGIQKF